MDYLNLNRLPRFIKKHVIKNKKSINIDKIFPHIGLNNFNIPVSSNIKWFKAGLRLAWLETGLLIKDRSYTRIFKYLLFTPLAIIDYLLRQAEYERFVKNLIGNSNVVFSSSGDSGVWDIATMSMRGVASCQRWDHSQAHRLVGSILDPCCGIIYITNNTNNEYGPNIFFRAVVRYVNVKNIGPCLFLERTYCNPKNDQYINIINYLFSVLLSSYSNLPVFSYTYTSIFNKDIDELYIPDSEAIRKLPQENLSYRDSHIKYMALSASDINKHKQFKLFEKIFNNNSQNCQ